MSNRVRNIISIVAVLVVVALVWQFGLKPRFRRFQAWEGTLVDAYRVYDGSRETGASVPEYITHRHYWVVECTDDEVRTLEMPYRVWLTGHVNDQIVKKSGQRDPEITTVNDESDQHNHSQTPPEANDSPTESPE